MTLRELAVKGRLLEIRCTDCHAKTPLDPAFFHARRGDIPMQELARTLVCPACGASEIGLGDIAPNASSRSSETA